MENYYEKPSFTAATTEDIYEVPQPQKAVSSSDSKVKKYSCNWKLSMLLMCLGVFAVVATVSLVLTVWSVVMDRNSFLHTEVTSYVVHELAALQDLQSDQQNQLDDFQDQLNSFIANLSLYSILQDLQTEQQNQLHNLQDQLNSFRANFSLYAALQNSQTRQQNQLDDLQYQLNSFMANLQLTMEVIRRINILGLTEDSPLSSCCASSLYQVSGYYWIRHGNGSAVRVYCDMTRSCGGVTGGWTRVAYLQFENGSDPCPQGFRERNDSGIRTCGINSTTAACPSILFDTYGIPYSRVYGKILGYQYSSPDAFSNVRRGSNPYSIDSIYVDGVSLTHGNPRQHIWTFVVALGVNETFGGCSCSISHQQSTTPPPAFIRQNYFCDSGNQGRFNGMFFIFHNNTLWDGAGCGPGSTCCSFNNPPWFHRELPSPTTDDIEMRVCSDEDRDNEDIPIAHVEIYVQ